MAKGYNSLFTQDPENTLVLRERKNFLRGRIKDKKRKNYYTIKPSILYKRLALLLLQRTTEIGSLARDYIPI